MEVISIIIPAYNADKTISRCIKSVQNNTFRNFHIYVIDDCSKDDTWNIIQTFEISDSRISTFRNMSNMGPSATRNVGLQNAKGEWICFVDADDEISSNFLGDLYEEGKNSGKDIVFCSIKQVKSDGTVFREIIPDSRYVTNSPEELLSVAYGKIDDLDFLSNLACSKIVKRSLFNGVKFPIDRLQEDAFITPYLIYNSANGSSVAPRSMYVYYDNPKSISHIAQNNIKDLKRREDLLFMYEHHIELYKSHKNRLFHRSRLNYLNNVIALFRLHYHNLYTTNKSSFRIQKRKFRKQFLYMIVERNPLLTKGMYFIFTVFFISPKFFMRLFHQK